VLRGIFFVLMVVTTVLAQMRRDSLAKIRDLTEPGKNDVDHTIRRMAELLGETEERGWIQFRIKDGEEWKYWCLELGPEGCKAHAGRVTRPAFEVVTPTFELITPAGTWWQIAKGSIAPLEAFGEGKMRIRGNVELGKLLLKRLASSEGGLVDTC
jgi:putative sterol carrier protein